MSEDNKPQGEQEQQDENVHFDMYHFFKRKDVMLIALFLLCLIIYVLYLMTAGSAPTTPHV